MMTSWRPTGPSCRKCPLQRGRIILHAIKRVGMRNGPDLPRAFGWPTEQCFCILHDSRIKRTGRFLTRRVVLAVRIRPNFA